MSLSARRYWKIGVPMSTKHTRCTNWLNRFVVPDGLRVSLCRYGTASPMSSMRPGDRLSCWEFNTLRPAANLTLVHWPEPITNKAILAKAAALEGVLNLKSGTNAGMNRWVSLKVWRVHVAATALAKTVGGVHDRGYSPYGAVMCDLDRFANSGAIIRRNVFQHGGHPQIGGRIKSSGAYALETWAL